MIQFSSLSSVGLITLLLMSLMTHAQTSPTGIRGIVVSDAGEGLNGVSVVLRGGKVHESTTTDDKGVFRFKDLPVNTRFDFSFSYVGYRDTAIHGFEVKPGEENALMVRLIKANN